MFTKWTVEAKVFQAEGTVQAKVWEWEADVMSFLCEGPVVPPKALGGFREKLFGVAP